MKNYGIKKIGLMLGIALVVGVIGKPASAVTDMSNYCSMPPFISNETTPNLLLMIDNSASMYDLTYVDEGKPGACSNDATIKCFKNADCTSGNCQITSGTLRSPSYCYDQTYASTKTYSGYFDSAKYYDYHFSSTNPEDNYFYEIGTFPLSADCDATHFIANLVCVKTTTSPKDVTKFSAKGSYLNWLVTSKFDVQKKILTGGKYDVTAQSLIDETRGCVGRSFIKEANTADFIEYTPSNPLNIVNGKDVNDHNVSLGITFGVKGPANPYNNTALSPGGQTDIDIFIGDYKAANCQPAITAISDPGSSNAAIKKAVDDCLSYTDPTGSYCTYDPDKIQFSSCNNNNQCNAGGGSCSTSNTGVCSVASDGICSVTIVGVCTASNGTCTGTGQNKTCSGGYKNGSSCNNDNDCKQSRCTAGAVSLINTVCSTGTDCQEKKCTAGRVGSACSSDANCNTSHCTAGKDSSTSCTQNSDCNPNKCSNHTVVTSKAPDKYNSYCSANSDCDDNKGPCVSATATTTSKTQVVFNQSMQACWAYRKGTDIGTDEVNTVENQCSDLYDENKICDLGDNDGKTCTTSADCPDGACINGPSSIRPGNASYLCSSNYVGYCAKTTNNWATTIWWENGFTSTSECIKQKHRDFCNIMEAPPVVDPTQAPSVTTSFDNLPAIITDVGIEAQLNQPYATLPVRVKETAEPTGLIQKYRKSIRMGAMTFNYNGSPTECGLKYCSNNQATSCSSDSNCTSGGKCIIPIPCPKQCSVATTVACTINADCPSGETCGAVPAGTNLDGARILDNGAREGYIGYGHCSVTTATECAKDAHCPSGETCRNKQCSTTLSTSCAKNEDCPASELCVNKVGSHSSGLISAIDGIPGANWTPFAEGYYNAIGYMARDSSDSKKSRSSLRINSSDYVDTLNPSEKRCQANNILLITDGMSTADRNGNEQALVTLYSSMTDTTGTGTGNCPDYSGSKNLDDLAWIGQHRNIATFNLSSSPSTSLPVNANEKINAYIVFNGASNGGTGQCDSQTLLNQTAINGGTSLYKAETPEQMTAALEQAMQQISKEAASGSAVSVLTTSSRGVGSMLQAYFLPSKTLDKDSVSYTDQWLGFVQNIWIDPNDLLREDTNKNTGTAGAAKLQLDDDNVMMLYFDTTSNNTKAALFTTDAEGNGGTLAQCTPGGYDVKDFTDINPLWEAGKKLANLGMALDGNGTQRTIFTAHPTDTTLGNKQPLSTSGGLFTVSNMTGNATLEAALNSDPTGSAFSAENIVKYIRGVSLETDLTYSTSFRSRLLPVSQGTGTATEVKVWKLGDVVNSTPKVVGNIPQNTYFIDYGDMSYYRFISSTDFINRTSLSLIGANDGMLHAFRVGYLKDRDFDVGENIKAKFSDDSGHPNNNAQLGDEVWAYIPYNALPYLRYYADKTYGSCHLWYVDLSVKLYDASIGTVVSGSLATPQPTTARPQTGTSWRTILIGGMRFGGSCAGADGSPTSPKSGIGLSSYFALDITTPENPIPLWEFTDDDLGYTSGNPVVMRTGDSNNNGNWYVVFGSGSKQLPKVATDINRTTPGYLYMLDLYTGALKKKINLGHNAIVGDVLAIDANKDYHSEKLYFGTSYYSSGWKGKIMSLSIKNADNSLPANVDNLCGTSSTTVGSGACPQLITLFDGSYPFTAAPDATKDDQGRTWVYAGSGKYFSTVDQTDTSQQLFIGFIDNDKLVTIPSGASGLATYSTCPSSCPAYNSSSSTNAGDLCNVSACKTSGTVPTTGATIQVCMYDDDSSSSTFGSFTEKTVVTQVNGTPTVPSSDVGWMFYLSSAERVISRPLAAGGIVDFLSYRPSQVECEYGGDSFIYAVDYKLGVAPSQVAIRSSGIVVTAETGGDSSPTTNAGGTATSHGDVLIQRAVRLGPGAPPTGEAIIITPPKEGQDKLKKKIQVATGVIVETENTPLLSTVSKIMHWLKK